MTAETDVWRCDVCGKKVSRLVGLVAAVSLPGPMTRIRSSVRGYCRDHRSAVVDRYDAELEKQGTVTWREVFDDVRPRTAATFLQMVDESFGMFSDPQTDDRGGILCPDCGSPVSLGAGPHIQEATARAGTTAWACMGCGAAGLARVP